MRGIDSILAANGTQYWLLVGDTILIVDVFRAMLSSTYRPLRLAAMAAVHADSYSGVERDFKKEACMESSAFSRVVR